MFVQIDNMVMFEIIIQGNVGIEINFIIILEMNISIVLISGEFVVIVLNVILCLVVDVVVNSFGMLVVGSIVQIFQMQDGWYEVQMMSGQCGWVGMDVVLLFVSVEVLKVLQMVVGQGGDVQFFFGVYCFQELLVFLQDVYLIGVGCDCIWIILVVGNVVFIMCGNVFL